jgi:hypothetical protein
VVSEDGGCRMREEEEGARDRRGGSSLQLPGSRIAWHKVEGGGHPLGTRPVLHRERPKDAPEGEGDKEESRQHAGEKS